MDILTYYETYLYAAVYFSMLAIMPLWEGLQPLRTNRYPLGFRWVSNFCLGVATVLVERAIFPLMSLGLALYVRDQGIGLFNIVAVPDSVAIIICILFLDLAAYLLHRLMHVTPIFWSFHKIHHSDPDYDFTTSFRFHPFEGILTSIISFVVIILLGAPLISIIIAQLMTVCVSFFAHGNVPLPSNLEKIIRLIFVTPNMHRIHHSTDEPFTNSNYGVLFPYWDYLGRTYTPVKAVDQKTMPVGLSDCQGKKYINIFWLLALPFIPQKKERTDP